MLVIYALTALFCSACLIFVWNYDAVDDAIRRLRG